MQFVFYMLSFCVHLVVISGNEDRPDVELTSEGIVQKYGYPIQLHEVTTDDGYMLTIFRIPHGKQGSGVNRKPILLMHGLFGQAENYIVAAMNNGSLAFFLADREFDVWIGNTRGNQHGRKHKTLDPNRRKFWNFSWHEVGIYDLPAMINYILEKTKKSQIFYTGHSQGGTSFYIMNSEKPEYQKKIVAAALLAPAGLMGHFENPIILPLAKAHKQLTALASSLKIYELPPNGISLPDFLKMLCQKGFLQEFCINVYHAVVNFGDSGEFNQEMLDLVMKFVPSVSPRQPLHYAQSIISGHFRQWDYGPEQNMQKYGMAEPPDYALENITIPITIYYGLADNLVYVKDIEESCERLANCVKELLPNPKWTHMDFIFSTHALKVLHEPILQFFQKYEKI